MIVRAIDRQRAGDSSLSDDRLAGIGAWARSCVKVARLLRRERADACIADQCNQPLAAVEDLPVGNRCGAVARVEEVANHQGAVGELPGAAIGRPGRENLPRLCTSSQRNQRRDRSNAQMSFHDHVSPSPYAPARRSRRGFVELPATTRLLRAMAG